MVENGGEAVRQSRRTTVVPAAVVAINKHQKQIRFKNTVKKTPETDTDRV